jgi:predicted nucleic acid-binding protein
MKPAQGGCFVDTSALYAVFDRRDLWHADAAQVWRELSGSNAPLFVSSYVLVEMTALLQNRLGMGAVDAFYTHVLPWLQVTWVDASLHAQGVAALFAAGRRDLSLVDCTSFVVIRRLGLRRVFSLDAHFRDQGFEVQPTLG